MEIKRDSYLEQLINRKGNGLIKVITGIRRCGKSYLLNTIFYNHLLNDGVKEDHIIKFAFDSADDLALIGESLIQIEKEKRKSREEEKKIRERKLRTAERRKDARILPNPAQGVKSQDGGSVFVFHLDDFFVRTQNDGNPACNVRIGFGHEITIFHDEPGEFIRYFSNALATFRF